MCWRPAVLLLLEALLDEVTYLRRKSLLIEIRSGFVHDVGHVVPLNALYLLWVEMHSARTLSRDEARRPYIRWVAVTYAFDQLKSLRRHICDCAHARHGKVAFHLLYDAKVCYFHCHSPLIVMTKNVARLQIAVDDPLFVEIAWSPQQSQ